ncbi:hypothetical protein PQX77_019261 [Marasmius sp. AFHP31]|nr:hypothetical protein PQX77_019261 [Marasmius sp. AFHP31]
MADVRPVSSWALKAIAQARLSALGVSTSTPPQTRNLSQRGHRSRMGAVTHDRHHLVHVPALNTPFHIASLVYGGYSLSFGYQINMYMHPDAQVSLKSVLARHRLTNGFDIGLATWKVRHPQMDTTYYENERTFVADSKDVHPQPVRGSEILLNAAHNLFTQESFGTKRGHATWVLVLIDRIRAGLALPQDGFPVREIMLDATWTKLLEEGMDWTVVVST